MKCRRCTLAVALAIVTWVAVGEARPPTKANAKAKAKARGWFGQTLPVKNGRVKISSDTMGFKVDEPKATSRSAIPRLSLRVQSIAGTPRERSAFLRYKDHSYFVTKGWVAPDKTCRVLSITPYKVEVFHRPTRSLKTFHF